MTDEVAEAPLDDLADHVATYRTLDKQIREWTTMRDELQKRIVAALGPARVGTVGGRPAVRYVKFHQRRLTTAKVRAKYSEEDLADCYTETEVTRFSLVKEG